MLALTGALHFPLVPLSVGLVGVTTTDHTSGNRAHRTMMSSNMTGDAADDGALDASLGIRRRSKRNSQSRGADEN